MSIGARDLLFLGVVVGGAGILGAGVLGPTAAHRSRAQVQPSQSPGVEADLAAIVAAVDLEFQHKWAEHKVAVAQRAPDLTVIRRLALSLCGSVPSLEEVRRFEARPAAGRIEAWVDDVLRDRQSADYLAERFARAFVGTEDGPFLLYRRRRFIAWLSDAIIENRPYDALVNEMIADKGLWTDHPATNFVSVTFRSRAGPADARSTGGAGSAGISRRADRLRPVSRPSVTALEAGRLSRSGVVFRRRPLRPARHSRRRKRLQAPRPQDARSPWRSRRVCRFGPSYGPKRAARASSSPHGSSTRANQNFARATVNRVWALLFGRPLAEPIDDLSAAGELHPALCRLADDFAAHGYNLHRLIRVIARRRCSASTAPPVKPPARAGRRLGRLPDDPSTPRAGRRWAVSGLFAHDARSPVALVHPARHLHRPQRFRPPLRRHGRRRIRLARRHDPAAARADEWRDRARARSRTTSSASPNRLAELAPDDRKAVEAAFLAVLTRRPTPEEESHFIARLAGTSGKERKERLIDLYWALLNTTEFSWNH